MSIRILVSSFSRTRAKNASLHGSPHNLHYMGEFVGQDPDGVPYVQFRIRIRIITEADMCIILQYILM